MKVLVILQGPAYGTEPATTGFVSLSTSPNAMGSRRRSSAFGDAVGLAVAGQQLPNGYYPLDRMITSAARHGAVRSSGRTPLHVDLAERTCPGSRSTAGVDHIRRPDLGGDDGPALGGILVLADGTPFAVMGFTVTRGLISEITAITRPERVGALVAGLDVEIR